jgi:hypothetical protein
MRLKAYVLAADPAWIEEGVLSYYDAVEEIVVSYDASHRGWTGAPINVEECLRRLRAIDRDGKMRFCGGDYVRTDGQPLKGETHQRQCAIAEAGDADWILQLDTDELLPNPARLIELLRVAEEKGIPAVEWPMRVFFQRLPDGRFLEVCQRKTGGHYEYPGPIAIRPGTPLASARRTGGPFLRAVVKGDRQSLQVSRPTEPGEYRVEFCEADEAIVHFSWVRTPAEIRSKIASWGHFDGWRSWRFYHVYWKSAPLLWRWFTDFHPFARGLWPALRPAQVATPTKPPTLNLQPPTSNGGRRAPSALDVGC